MCIYALVHEHLHKSVHVCVRLDVLHVCGFPQSQGGESRCSITLIGLGKQDREFRETPAVATVTCTQQPLCLVPPASAPLLCHKQCINPLAEKVG